MPLDLRMNEIFPISDFVRNASAHTARIRQTNRAEILTQHGRPSLAVMPAEEYERLIDAAEYLDGIEAVRIGLEAAEAGRSKPALEAIREWETL
ncbi:MAG: type II toxin-antitoxin system Phd/YefM family antitoxin [Luteolibacter sp.]|uniref:type II toxin-antitoxin system Phd/YefM family antitoxin n=1 Tax=Luteolibacter sp. TaxID=1962973 RepID=UPI0032644E6D